MNYEIGSRNQGKFPNSYLLIPNFRRIAHRSEHRSYKLGVAGSTPASPTAGLRAEAFGLSSTIRAAWPEPCAVIVSGEPFS